MIKKTNKQFNNFRDAGYIVELSEFVLLPESEQSKIRNLALPLTQKIEEANKLITGYKINSEFPVIKADKNDFEYFRYHVLPSLGKISSLCHEDPEIWLQLMESLKGIDFGSNIGVEVQPDPIQQHIKFFVNTILSNEPTRDEFGDIDEEVYINSADVDFDLLRESAVWLSSEYFSPQKWISRSEEASLLFSQRDIKKYKMGIRGRIKEAYSCYVVGHNLACISTCRSLLEYVLLDRAKSNSKWQFDPYKEINGKKRKKDLYEMSMEIENIDANLSSKLAFIREEGNRVLHTPPGREVIEFPPQDETARKSLTYIFEVIEQLYSESDAQQKQ